MKEAEIIENKQINYHGIVIPYTINYGNRKNMYICIKECNVAVKVPHGISSKKIENFIETKTDWIYKSIKKQVDTISKRPKYQQGEQIKILGQSYTIVIEYTNKKRSTISIQNKNLIIQLNEQFKNQDTTEEIKNQLEKLYYAIAQDEVAGAMEEVTNLVGLQPKEYKIKKLKRAWGNCSSKKIIAINMEVVKFDREFIKYVVLHEICHLKYMNHSKMFWNMVETYMPNYKQIKGLASEK